MLDGNGSLVLDTCEDHLRVSGDLDLAGCRFIDPYGLVHAAVAAERAGAAGQRTWNPPEDPDIARYCERMDLVEVIRRSAGMEPRRPLPPAGARLDRQDVLAELRRLDAFDGATPAVAHLVFRRLEGHGPAEEAFNCVAEACQNVGDHAGAPGYVAAQVYRSSPPARVVLAIADGGQGIAASLAGLFGALSDDEALRLVVDEGASASGLGGTGIAGMLAVVDDLGGELRLRSGTALCHRVGGRTSYAEGVAVAGTAVGIALPCRD